MVNIRLDLIASVVCVSISLSGCLALAAGAGAETAYVGTQEDRTAGEVIDDQRITAAVKTRLLADPDVPGMDVNVDTFKRVVTLRGVLKNSGQVDKAMELARSVSGVRDVRSDLFVR
ncbi:MAG: BON domain-containing protein [Oligoflexia bacterium]|nr:BON domain-containing protein [Oligoflexia bacterium]